MSDAESIDQRIELRAKETAKASEMAGEEVDRLGDPLATDEERQIRKRRLIEAAAGDAGNWIRQDHNSRRFCAVPDSVQARRFAKVANNAERFETRGSVKAGAQSAT
jgi:hypothetical protein